jgi:hypothetical protein
MGKAGVNKVIIKNECKDIAKQKKLKGKTKKGFIKKCMAKNIRKKKKELVK